MPKSPEIEFVDDGDNTGAISALQGPSAAASSSSATAAAAASAVSAQRSAALAAQLGITDQEPPWWSQQLSRASSLIFNGGLVALVRAWVNPPVMEVPAGEALPDWYTQEWVERTRWRRMGNQVARDTAALAGVMLLMDGVESGMRSVRGGKEDPWNRVMGGVTSGGLLGLLWYPANPRGRGYMTGAGAFVGYFSYLADKAVDASLLQTQQQLEHELLQKPLDQVRTGLSRPYLQSLLRAKQRQLNDEARRAVAEMVQEEQRSLARQSAATTTAAASASAGADASSYGSGQSFTADVTQGSAAPAGGSQAYGSGFGAGPATGRGSGSSGGGVGGTTNDRGVLVITEEDDTPAPGTTAGDDS